MIESPEKAKIFASGETRVETKVGAGVIADLLPNGCGLASGIEAGNARSAVCRKEQSGEDAKKSCFSGAICAEQGYGFATLHFKRNAAQRRDRGSRERLHKGTPAGAGWRKKFFKRIDGDGRVGH